MDRVFAGRVLLGIGTVGALVSVLAMVVGWRFLSELDGALESSLGVTAEALDALDASVALADETVGRIEAVLTRTERTTDELAGTIDDTAAALEGVADLSEQELAGSLAAVERSLPALIDVAAVIDRTLGALSRVPFGPDYDPDEPFDDSLREIQRQMDGLPEGLREQAALIRDGQRGLSDLGRGVEGLADEVGAMAATLAAADELLDEYASTAGEAQQVIADSDSSLGTQLAVARGLVVALGLVLVVGQLVPLGLGWILLRPEAGRAFLAT